ncbi:phage head morphogenesis protein [Limosilactobacillus sp.]|jgi:SPP1 gp7 family putative phage head morphogenesis protein|uniref:phage head morphogenesis protein n=1 Tax=Limosilactobacillus sp. TaxID=2773925 RepID=UPI0025C4448B|nr:phage head morphogenesis protein [Limosilactobacillus sp.]MCH3922377.1 phage head morphogenesis protein [Limosilactobacillus sp.]MCH3929149.1 phage head morphogenesis protein [Limosilactobacillus sp.]
MTDQEWFDQLNKIFNPADTSVQRLEDIVTRAEHKQEVSLDHFFNNGLRWNSNADPNDIRDAFEALRVLRAEATTAQQRAVLGALLNNLPYRTNKDVAELTSRINIAQLGLDVADHIAQQQALITDKVTQLTGKGVQGYNSQLRRRALMRIAVQSGNDTDTLPLVFKHMQSLAIDMDKVIDYQVQNHMNPNSMKKAAAEALKKDKLWNFKSDGWKTAAQKRYMHTKSDIERVYVTEAKVTQVKAVGKELKLKGYKYVKVVSRHNSHTCSFCDGMDKTRVKIDEMVAGVNVPPFHPRCACNIIPAETPVKEALADMNL